MVKKQTEMGSVKVYRIPINSPFELRIAKSNEKIAIFVYHRIFNSTPKLRCILLSKEEVRKLHHVLGKIVNEDSPIIQLGEKTND